MEKQGELKKNVFCWFLRPCGKRRTKCAKRKGLTERRESEVRLGKSSLVPEVPSLKPFSLADGLQK